MKLANAGRAFRRLFDSDDLPWLAPLPPWSGARDRQVREVRRAARALIRRREVALHGWPRVLLASALWPAVALVKSLRVVRTARRPHRSFQLSVLDLWWLQVAHNHRLADLYHYCIAEPTQRRTVRRFVNDLENTALLRALTRDAPSRTIRDKRTFAAFCARHQLPTVPILATGAGGTVDQATAHWPAGDLFLKPSNLWGGHGACILRHDPATASWRCDDTRGILPSTLASFVQSRFGHDPWVLQPRLGNSPEWGDLAPPDSALATVRVVTFRAAPATPPRVLLCFARIPLRGSTVDNLSAGGIGADCDPATGRLQAARTLKTTCRHFPCHPDTGARIEGNIVPRWPEIIALALRAHEAVPDIDTLGWDVALPPGGLILIEVNLHWGVPLDLALGDTPYIEHLLQPSVARRLRP